MWIPTSDLPTPHPCYQRVNAILTKHGFDNFVEGLCAKFYAARKDVAPLVAFGPAK